MRDSIGQARNVIRRRLVALKEEQARLEGALTALDNGERRPPGAQPKRRSKPAGRRAPRGQRESQFLAALERKPGSRAAEVAREMGVRPQQVHAIARKLTEAGRVEKRDGGFVAISPAPLVPA